MKKLTTTVSCQPPSATDMELMLKLMDGVNACFTALALDCEFTPAPKGLTDLLTGGTRKQIATEVVKCNRVVAYITFPVMGPQAEICFSEGKNIVKKIGIVFGLQTREFFVAWK